MIRIIAAMSKNNVIGRDNKLIWSLPDDLKRFKELTMGHYIIMGRKTYESIGKPLPGRKNIVISRNPNLKIKGVEIFSDILKAIEYTNNNCFIIGGSEIYKQTIDLADFLYLTIINANLNGDSYFPQIDSNWILIYDLENNKDDKHMYSYSFKNYSRLV